ncbi:hypothetical protein BU17DRAFT_87361 [Hysterangium stoloniferum]|nr:hypothetical protein BU17DRAFT_87361 [Hysterangium stoloniferum]
MSNQSQLPPDTQRSSSSLSANQSSTENLLRMTTRRTSLEDEQRQDREVLEPVIAPQGRQVRPQSDHSEPPHTPPAGTGIRNAADELSPRFTLTLEETEWKTAAAFKDFENYIKILGYWEIGRISMTSASIVRGIRTIVKTINPNLALSSHLFGVCGSGGLASGSSDFKVVTEMLQSMSTWNTGDSDGHSKNAKSADRVFAMLLFVRLFVLKQLVQHLPFNTDATVARRRWVLAQVLPPCLPKGEDLFSMLNQFMTKRLDLFPAGIGTPLFVVIDEAQVAADHLKEYFRSNTGSDPPPILREMYKFFLVSNIFAGIILSGTGLSMKIVKDVVGSTPAKQSNTCTQPQVFTDIGRFMRGDSSQEDYIHRYLTLSGNDSDRRLLERMVYWFSGHHRLTASLIELFLCFENVPRHRVFTSFVEHLTGFKITDTIELEGGEPTPHFL